MVKDLRAQLRRSEEEVATLQVRFCFKFCMDERGDPRNQILVELLGCGGLASLTTFTALSFLACAAPAGGGG